MRVVLLGSGVQPIPPTGYGGIERFLSDLSAALRAEGHEVLILNRVRHRRQRDEYPFAWELPRLLRGERYDALHANSPVVANRLAFSGHPFVYTTHSRHWYYRERLTHRWGYWLERRAVRRAAVPVALTPALARTIAGVAGPTRRPIAVIPFGVDLERFRPAPELRHGSAALGVGIVAPFKRWEAAAAALRGTGFRLTIVGPTPDPAYAELVRAAGDAVTLTGEVSDDELVRHYAESDLLVHPSRAELLSGAVVQGLAAGLPVVGGPTLNGVVEEGRTGWIVDDADTARFVAGIRAAVTAADPATLRRFGDAARRAASERYSWPSVVERYVAAYRIAAADARTS